MTRGAHLAEVATTDRGLVFMDWGLPLPDLPEVNAETGEPGAVRVTFSAHTCCLPVGGQSVSPALLLVNCRTQWNLGLTQWNQQLQKREGRERETEKEERERDRERFF
mmetsp:Transcript_44704/g.87585  ORF Transcript_44704/g.87585 Transcript_44704/m.87585 type:complete len:108 (-) Transcript_44704:13-336(-)